MYVMVSIHFLHISIINIFCIVCRIYSKQVTRLKDQVKQAVSMRKMKALYVIDGKVLSENSIEQHILYTSMHCFTLAVYVNKHWRNI